MKSCISHAISYSHARQQARLSLRFAQGLKVAMSLVYAVAYQNEAEDTHYRVFHSSFCLIQFETTCCYI